MLIQSLEQKTRLALTTVLLTIIGSTVVCAFCIFYCAKLVTEERSQIYVIDGDIPFLAERSKQEANFIMEAKAHIQLFHQYFFNLPPDDDYIKWTLSKAMYMADGTALKQKQAMEENGFYSDIVSSSAVCMIICDSIKLDEQSRKFKYYGTQIIKRRSRDMKRSLITVGSIENVPRTRNNPHGLLITNWRTLEKAKARWENEAKGKVESFVRKLSLQWKVRERIDAANAWAVKHPKRTATMTIGALICSLCLGIVVSLYTPQSSKDIVGEIENVQPMFAGLQSIQNGKNVQVHEVGQLALRGQRLKWELDSLVHIPVKTHQDSMLIISKYRQLEMIVANLKHQ